MHVRILPDIINVFQIILYNSSAATYVRFKMKLEHG
jgi:hypothetical protein